MHGYVVFHWDRLRMIDLVLVMNWASLDAATQYHAAVDMCDRLVDGGVWDRTVAEGQAILAQFAVEAPAGFARAVQSVSPAQALLGLASYVAPRPTPNDN